MENLNAENITNEIKSLIKALKDCGGWVKRGNGEGWFNHEILADALALITAQEQRIKELTEENERLQAEITHLEGHREADIKAFKTLRADTVRKMQERFKSCFEDDVQYDGFRIAIWIDQIAKEMLEGEK